MRRLNYQSAVYAIVIILILIGAGLFLFRGQIIELIRQNSDLASLQSGAPAAPAAASDAVSSAILQNEKFRALKNNVVNFDFDRICWRPTVPAPAAVLTPDTGLATATDQTTSTSVNLGCVLGNNNPVPPPPAKISY